MIRVRVPSWVSNDADRDERLRHAERLVGLSISAVRYFDIDYERIHHGIETAGPRSVTGAAEWATPSWRGESCDSLDYGFELETTSGRVFSITWDLPGLMEGIGIREEPLLGNALSPDSQIAVWDVGERSRWQDYRQDVVTAVTMHYAPWDDSGAWWCDRITILVGRDAVEILLADWAPGQEAIAPSANNVVVLFNPAELPTWVNSAPAH